MTRLERASGLCRGEHDSILALGYCLRCAVIALVPRNDAGSMVSRDRIAASLALDGYPTPRKPPPLAVTNLYPGNTFKGWGKL